MDPDDHVCICFKVSLRKLHNYLDRVEPVVPSQLSDCLGAGTGCQWCVPFLEKLHEQWRRGENPDLPIAPAEYLTRRAAYRRQKDEHSPEPPSIPPAPPHDPSNA